MTPSSVTMEMTNFMGMPVMTLFTAVSGNDYLYGGDGDDTLTGGLGQGYSQ